MKNKMCCNSLLKLANEMQNVVFNEPKAYTQVSIDNYLIDEASKDSSHRDLPHGLPHFSDLDLRAIPSNIIHN